MEVALVGDELEISFGRSYRRLVVAHPIEGVELRPIEGPRPVLTLVNRTDRTFEVVHFNGAVLFDVVRAEPDGWAGPRETPTLWCGFGVGGTTIAPRSSVPLGSVEHGSTVLEGSLDAQTVVMSHARAPDRRSAARSRAGRPAPQRELVRVVLFCARITDTERWNSEHPFADARTERSRSPDTFLNAPTERSYDAATSASSPTERSSGRPASPDAPTERCDGYPAPANAPTERPA